MARAQDSRSQLVSTRLLQGRATQVETEHIGHAGTHARRAGCGSAETHWQGPRTAAAASLHRAAAGQHDSGRLESGQSTRGEGTRSQSSGSRVDTLARAKAAAAASLHRAAAWQGDSSQDSSTGGEGTRSQSSGSRGDTLARAQDSRRS